ncbi:dihydrolipoyllysine-residue acetyltransferase [Cardiobacteriaceae bacterium TAE3-ERU3]|nr:dihydrolipoyllysine-residue acetyltransferase [Cardiobacteriaceae bacterium TAE3-ERU3]
MSIQIRVPDIGDFDAVDVIEVLINEGDEIQAEQSVLVLESDKASMEVPAEQGGKVTKVLVKVGDQVKEGDVIAELEAAEGAADSADNSNEAAVEQQPEASSQEESTGGETQPLTVPDIGDFDAVDVIEVNVEVGDQVEAEQGIITLESDKASMEVPSPSKGEIVSLSVKVGDKVATGDVIGEIRVGGGAKQAQPAAKAEKVAEKPAEKQEAKAESKPAESKQQQAPASQKIDEESFSKAHASPSVRRFARELGADLGKVKGSGRKGRILEDDVKAFIKQALASGGASANAATQGSGIPPIPAVDFSKFGEVEEQKLSRINILTGEAMTRCWLNIPHVTQHDLADITELEAFRKSLKAEAEKRGVRVTMLAFLMKALAKALQELPRFNSSLSPDKKSLILKKYIHIGIAVDTPNGLVVPVIRDVDKKGIYELSEDLMAMSKKARDGKLSPSDMQGASMTISSLGGIGGTYFTPIVNAPEVAILGVSRSSMQPVWNGKEFEPRLMLPMSLSYDHRVIDGALAARMTVLLGQLLSDMKRSLL